MAREHIRLTWARVLALALGALMPAWALVAGMTAAPARAAYPGQNGAIAFELSTFSTSSTYNPPFPAESDAIEIGHDRGVRQHQDQRRLAAM